MKRKNKKIKIVIGVIVLIVVAFVIVFTSLNKVETEEKIAPDGVDVLPDISFNECLSEIIQVNPEMNEQQARDNCYAIDAINKNDISICDKVSDSARENCLDMFD